MTHTLTPTRTQPHPAAASLRQLFAKHQLALDPVELLTYEVDAGFDRGQPDGVFFPESSQDVSRIMQWATEHGVPLVAHAAQAPGCRAAPCPNMAASCSRFRA